MWRYEQRTGRLWRLAAEGYSGHGDEGKNQPDMEWVRNVGPIPKGRWLITEKFDDAHKGPWCLRLQPAPGTDTHGRSGFLVHGDSISQPGTASEGCIILNRAVRQRIWESEDRELEVVP